MNILHIIDEPWDSGIVHYALSLASGLQARGHKVLIWAKEESPPYRAARDLGLKTFSCSRPWRRLRELRRNLIEEKIEIVNAHTGSAHALAVLLAKIPGPRSPSTRPVRVVRTRADARPVAPKPLASLLYRNTRGFIAANQKIKEQFSKLGASPLAAIYQGIPLKGNKSVSDTDLSQSPVIGMAGRLDPVKGHRFFLQAAAQVRSRFPQARFLIAGREENLKIADFAPLLSELKLEGSAEFLGHVPDILAFMRKCSVGVVASTGSEAVSRAALEWMAAERPLVAASVGCLPELVEEGVTGFLVPPEDPPAMARRLAELMDDPELRKTMGQNAAKRAREKFGFEKFIEETEGFYAEVLKNA